MTKNIIIYGSGGFGRECYQILQDCINAGQSLKFKGFISNRYDLEPFDDLKDYYLGSEEEYEFDDDDYVVIGIGNPIIIRKIYTRLKEKSIKFHNLIHPLSGIGRGCLIGEANIFCSFSGLTCDVNIGNGNIFNSHSGCGHDVVVGDFNVLSAFTELAGGVKMGNGNFLGTHSCVLPKAKIGDSNTLSAGSVIYKGAKNNVIMHGNPAMKVGTNDV